MSSADSRQKAISLIEQLPQDTLVAVVQLLEFLAAPLPLAPIDVEAARLLTTIQKQPSDIDQTRLNELRDRCEWDQLSDLEHQELIHYEDAIEQHRVERLEALLKLAKLRNIDLISLNRQIPPQSSHAA
jgi:hypothetical protein